MVLYGLVYADDEITMHGRPETGPKCCGPARPAVRADGANLGVIERGRAAVGKCRESDVAINHRLVIMSGMFVFLFKWD